jgi:hypothetical protein
MIPKGPGGTNLEAAGFGFRWYLEGIFTSSEEGSRFHNTGQNSESSHSFWTLAGSLNSFIFHFGRTDSPEGSNLFHPLPHFPHGFSGALISQHESSQPILFHPDFFQDPPRVGYPPPGPGTAHEIPAGPFRASEKGHSIGAVFQCPGQLKHFQLSGTGKRYSAKMFPPGTIQPPEDLMDLFSLPGAVKNSYMDLRIFHAGSFEYKT